MRLTNDKRKLLRQAKEDCGSTSVAGMFLDACRKTLLMFAAASSPR